MKHCFVSYFELASCALARFIFKTILFWSPPRGFPTGTIFAHKIARERQSLFGQKCELVFVRKRTKAESHEGVTSKKDRHPFGCLSFFGGATQIRTGGRGVADLCLTTWPWRHIFYNIWIISQRFLIVNSKIQILLPFYQQKSTARGQC